jgi:tetratricopeptide (TPR) repeat protein
MQSPNRIRIWVKTFIPLIIVLTGMNPFNMQIHQIINSTSQAKVLVDFVNGADLLNKVIWMEPWRGELYEKIGYFDMKSGNLSEAGIAFEQAAHLNRLSLQGWLDWGDLEQKNANPSSAKDIWTLALRSYPKEPGFYDRLWKNQEKAGQLDQEFQTLSEWINNIPNSAQANYRMGLLLAVRQPNLATEYLQKSADLDSEYKVNTQKIINGLVLSSVVKDPAVKLLQIGRALGGIGEWNLAQVPFQQAVSQTPHYAEAWAFLGEAEQQNGKDGLKELETARSLNPQSVIVQSLFSLYWRRQGNPAAALVYSYAAMNQEPQNALWEMELGETLSEMGEISEALDHFQKATYLEPSDSIYWEALSRFCIINSVEANTTGLDAARQALILDPKNPSMLDLMGWAFQNMNDLDNAKKFFLQSIQQDDKYAPARLHLGQVYLQLDQNNLAYDQFALVVNLSKDEAILDTTRRLIQNYFPDSQLSK